MPLLAKLFLLALAVLPVGCQSNDSQDVVVAYTTSWCSGCKAQLPPATLWAKSNGVGLMVEDLTNRPRVAKDAGVHEFPTFVFYRSGVELYRTNDYHDLYVPIKEN